MTSLDSVREIIATYKRHGWILRRVLLSEAFKKALADRGPEVFGEYEIRNSEIDAAWFSRPPKPGETAWELRYLGDIPYALLEYVDENSAQFEAALAEVEARMAETIVKNNRLDF